jgi:hypothetical protein
MILDRCVSIMIQSEESNTVGIPSVMLLHAKYRTVTAAVSKNVAMNEPSIR